MSFFDEPDVIHQELQREKHVPLDFQGTPRSKSSPSGSDTCNNTNQGTSTSGDDQHVVDDRKQQRMLSNRESARRSRLRKQQHLDELRLHAAQLRAQHSHMLASFSVTSKHYAQVAEENQILRAEAIDLSHRLQNLHDVMASQEYSDSLTGSKEGSQSLNSY